MHSHKIKTSDKAQKETSSEETDETPESSPQLNNMATPYGKLKLYALVNNFAKLLENKYMYEGRREIKLQGPDQRPVNFKNALEKMRKGNHLCVHCNEEYV